MPPLVRETLTWVWAYIQHVVVMFYWFWIPGALVLGFLGIRYRPVFEGIAVQQRQGARTFWAAIGWGMTSGAGRRAGLEAAETLWRQGFPDRIVLTYLVSSQSMVLYSLLLFAILIGLEFALGMLLGGLAMIGFLCLLAPAPAGENPLAPATRLAASPPETGTELLGSARGWGRVVRDLGGYLGNVGASLIGGLILGALVLALDSEGHWFFPGWMGDEILIAMLAGSFLAPLLSVVLFLAPGGNLIVVSSIWKTWTLTYSGLISFVLAGLLNPLTVRALLRHYGGSRGWRLVLATYLSAALSGLMVAGLFRLLGAHVTHVPWFRDLVDTLIKMFPFTMFGTSGGGMKGM